MITPTPIKNTIRGTPSPTPRPTTRPVIASEPIRLRTEANPKESTPTANTSQPSTANRDGLTRPPISAAL